jgi:hypothetical protein
MNEDVITLIDIIKGRESNPELYETWDRACREQLGYSIEDVCVDRPVMVPERGFPFHAKFMAEEGGLVNGEWSHNHIDWLAAAEEIKERYDSIVVDGITYYCGGTD